MLYDFAILPEVFDGELLNRQRYLNVIVKELLRGIADNGLVANLDNGRWITYVFQQLANERGSAAIRDSVKSCLTTLQSRNRIITRTHVSSPATNDELRWLTLALECHADCPFEAIVLTEEQECCCGCKEDALVAIPDALDSSRWLRRRRTVSLRRTEDDYRSYLPSVLRHAQKLRLIDPYLTPHKDRFYRTVSICSELMGQRGSTRRKGIIEIHAGDPTKDVDAQHADGRPESKTERLHAWRDVLTPLAAQHGHRFRVFMWRRKDGGWKPHDRYIITDQCGMSTPGGLDCWEGENGPSTDWSLLEYESLAGRLRDFQPCKSQYECLLQGEIF